MRFRSIVTSWDNRGFGIAKVITENGQPVETNVVHFVHGLNYRLPRAVNGTVELVKLHTVVQGYVDMEVEYDSTMPPHIPAPGRADQAKDWVMSSIYMDALAETLMQQRIALLRPQMHELTERLAPKQGYESSPTFNPVLMHEAEVTEVSEYFFIGTMTDGTVLTFDQQCRSQVILRGTDAIICHKAPALGLRVLVGMKLLFASAVVEMDKDHVVAVAVNWVVKEEAMKVATSAKKARETLAKKAEEAAEAKRKADEGRASCAKMRRPKGAPPPKFGMAKR